MSSFFVLNSFFFPELCTTYICTVPQIGRWKWTNQLTNTYLQSWKRNDFAGLLPVWVALTCNTMYIRTTEAPHLTCCIRSLKFPSSVHLCSHNQSDLQVYGTVMFGFLYIFFMNIVFLFLISRYQYTWLAVLCTPTQMWFPCLVIWLNQMYLELLFT